MTLLSDLAEAAAYRSRTDRRAAPVRNARALFDELRFTVRPADEAGWDEIQQRSTGLATRAPTS